MYRLGSAVAAVLLAALAAAPAVAGTVASAASSLGYTGALTDTFVIWGDTQSYTADGTAPCSGAERCEDLETQAVWVCAHKATENIKAVLGVGDIVFNELAPEQYDNARNATDVLTACGVPYIPTHGNHELTVGGTFPSNPDVRADATNYWTYYGIPADTAPWFAGRGDYEEIAGPGSTFSAAGTNLYVETNNTGSRSFWSKLGGRIAVVSTEWELGARITINNSSCGDTAATWGWAQTVMAENPDKLFVHISHTGPCGLGQGTAQCDDWTDTVGADCTSAADWKRYRDEADNALVFVHGHRASGGACPSVSGAGVFKLITRDSGTSALMGGFDFNCGIRARNATAYGWSGRLRLKRGSNQLCLQTMRTIDASVTPAVETAYPLIAADLDRPDNGNSPETCATVVLPEALR